MAICVSSSAPSEIQPGLILGLREGKGKNPAPYSLELFIFFSPLNVVKCFSEVNVGDNCP